MKTKLLKKIRKRYDWYFNKDKFPVLVDHLKKDSTAFTLQHALSITGEKEIREIEVEHTEYALRVLKYTILSEWGWGMSRERYKYSMKKLKEKQKRVFEIKKYEPELEFPIY